jgi:hypothetical protein
MATANLIQTSVSGRTQNALAAQGDGLILPKVSSADRIALALTTADAGLQVYDTTAGAIYIWNGTAWVAPSVTYTQGIWTPTFSPTTGTITLDPVFATGLWSRIGNTVTVVGRFKVLAINSPTGLLTLTNLPYPVVAGFESAACVAATGLNNGARTAISGTIFGLGLEIYHYDSGTLLNIANRVLAGSDWYVSGTYITG